MALERCTSLSSLKLLSFCFPSLSSETEREGETDRETEIPRKRADVQESDPACDGTHRRRSELVGCICLCFSPHPPPLRQPWQPRLDPNLLFSSRSPRSYPVPNLCRPLNQNRGRDIVNLGRSPVSQSFSPLLRMHIFLEPFTEMHTHAVRKKNRHSMFSGSRLKICMI